MVAASNTHLIRALIVVTAAAMLLLVPAGSASASDEPEYSLSASPNSISWPDAPDFQYRLDVAAGTEPLDVKLKFPDPGWGYGQISGSVFSPDTATLDGPGELTPGDMPALVPPAPGTCWRGTSPWAALLWYRLTLDAGESTTVVVPSQLTAAPLEGTPRQIRARVWTDTTEPIELTAPVTIAGTPGAAIESWFVGEEAKYWIDRFADQQFRLRGKAIPALGGRLVRITAQRVAGGDGSSEPILLGTVRTDGNGNFRTEPLFLYDSGTWALRATLVSPGEFDSTPACAGAVIVQPAEGNLTEANLNGHIYRSIRIKGRKMGRKRIRFNFFRHASTPTSPKAPTLGVSAGCNSMGARYLVGKGRLRWTGPVMSTMMGCTPKRMRDDRWLQRNLRRGMKAALKGKRLTLTRGKVRIVLRQTK